MKLKTFFDSLTSFVSGLGTTADPSKALNPEVQFYGKGELEALYTSWLGGKVVDLPVDAATRNWRRFEAPDLVPEKIAELEAAEKAFKVRPKVNQAMKWSRVYGGGALILIVEGHGGLRDPLDVTRVRQNQLKNIIVADAQTLVASRGVYLQEIDDPNFGMPEYYRLAKGNTTSTEEIHHTRVVRFEGHALPWSLFVAHNYWGQSTLERCVTAVKDAMQTSQNTAALVFRASAEVMKIKDLKEAMSDPESENRLIKRLQLMAQMKSNTHMAAIDSEEEISTSSVGNFSGLDQIMERFMTIVSSASDIPVTRLVGTSAKGLNATGEGDEKNWHETVENLQTDKLREPLEKLDEVLIRSVWGEFPDDLTFRFNDLFVESEKAKSERLLKRAQADVLYIQNDVVPPEVVARDLMERDDYLNLTEDDITDPQFDDEEGLTIEPDDDAGNTE